MLEKELFTPLKKAFKILGIDVYAEVSLSYGSAIDCIGFKHSKLIGVELKVSNTSKLLTQAIRTKKYCHYTFVATPIIPEDIYLNKLSKIGCGFILIKDNNIDLLLKPKENNPQKNLILHPSYKHNIGGTPSSADKKTIYQQLYADIHAYLIARKGTAIPIGKITTWVRSYCIGKITQTRIKKIITTSPDIIEYNGFVMYLNNYIRHLPHELSEFVNRAIERYRNGL